ncbi:MAG: nitrite/sulfite reductase, partial [Bacteroidota bacterium]
MADLHDLHSKEDVADILELEDRIQKYKTGQEDEDRFKLYRLTRGVYGQRQLGVQMFRIKIPYGKISPNQIRAVADLSDEYASSNLHLTTRQDIQLHYVKLDDSPAVWVGLSKAGLTGREACGNTVRNLCASAEAGVDPNEPFDVTPYAHTMAYYFLRNPICQAMGRKIKIAFSSSELDSAFGYFHDFGFIPRIRKTNGKEERGFKVYLGGGLGAVAMIAPVAYDFLPEDEIIPFTEAALRVFDRYGEREKRQKARMKFLVKKLGVDDFLKLVDEEKKGIKHRKFPIATETFDVDGPVEYFVESKPEIQNEEEYQSWLKANVFEQKQKGFFGVYLKIPLGDISSENARKLAEVAEKYASQDIRITVNQGILLKYVYESHLPALYNALQKIGFGEIGFDSIGDITACPGTDTCNLAVTNSTGLSTQLEHLIKQRFPEYLEKKNIRIKISGCMNACGQHMAANIGFHGSSIKRDNKVIPAMQIVLGGGLDPDGTPRIGDKVIKIPTKKIPASLLAIVNDYEEVKEEGEYFNSYYRRHGKKYFYELLQFHEIWPY